MPDPASAHAPAGIRGRIIVAYIVGQLGVHAAMAGLRMAAPLQVLREGFSAWTVGLLLALFSAAPVLLALSFGRLADRHGYHRPVRVAVLLTLVGGLFAVGSTFVGGWLHFVSLCIAASFTGAGANLGMLAIQRTAGLAARDSAERVRLFSWLGVAPSFSNVVGPVLLGVLIDLGGFRVAYLAVLLLPLLTVWSARRVPRSATVPPTPRAADAEKRSSWSLLRAPGMKRLLGINWLMSMCWDVHTFAVPVLGHEFGFSASTIGLILGTFTLSVTLVRLVIPFLAHRVSEVMVVRTAMLGTGFVFALYPLARSPWLMGACAVLLGITLGVVQPMIMSTLHHLTPDGRHGEALAFRSMAINLSSTMMPLAFGALGVALGAGALFWFVGAAVAAGAYPARRLKQPARDDAA